MKQAFHKNWFYTNYAWILLNLPALAMLIMLMFDPSFWEILTAYSGYTALILLVTVLALNPLSVLLPKFPYIKKINRYRRQIGIAVFSYAMIHFICYFIKKDYSISKVLSYFFHPAILPAAIALLLFGFLTLTSNDYFVKKMGYRKWKNWHKTVYLAEVLVFIHMYMVNVLFYALLAFIPLAILQILRKIKKTKTDEVPY